jgi:hypothetical protein
MVDRDHGYQVLIHHQFQTLRLQCRVMAAVVAHFVEYRSGQQIWTGGDRRLAAGAANFPLQILPAQPIAALRIAREKQDFACCGQFDRQDETRIVSRRIELQGHRFRIFHPRRVNAAPRLIMDLVTDRFS